MSNNQSEISSDKEQNLQTRMCKRTSIYNAFPDVDALHFTVEYVSEYNGEAET